MPLRSTSGPKRREMCHREVALVCPSSLLTGSGVVDAVRSGSRLWLAV